MTETNWIYNIQSQNKRVYSQDFQDGIIEYIFENIGTINNFCVEFGFNSNTLTGGSGANSAYLITNGWKGLLLDGNFENPEINLHKEFLTPENIISVFKKYSVPEEFDYLSIDVDSSELWLMKTLLTGGYKPRLISIEYNANFHLGMSYTVKPDTIWKQDAVYGASLSALNNVAEASGYILIAIVKQLDLFFIRKDLIDPPNFPLSHFEKYAGIPTHCKPTPERLKAFVEYPTMLPISENVVQQLGWASTSERKIYLMPFQDQAFNGDPYVATAFLNMAEKNNCSVAFETGTCLGGTTKFLASNFETVHTVEINPTYMEQAIKFVNNQKVRFHSGPSETISDELISKLDDRNTIFFLDAHWGPYCPLLKELEYIAKHRKGKDVIVIHDFKVPDNSGLGFDTYNGSAFDINFVAPGLDAIYGKNNYNIYYNTEICGAKRGVLFVDPKTESEGISILVPTYNRPDWLERLANSIDKCSILPNKIELILGVHQDDVKSIERIDKIKPNLRISIRKEFIRRYADGKPHLSFFWNQLYERACYNIIGYFGDDVIFQTPGWDIEVRKEFNKDPIILLSCNDFHFQKGVATLFFTHKYVHDKIGFYLPIQFRRWFSDTYWDQAFNLAGKKIYRKDIITEHLHPDKFPELADATYKAMGLYINEDLILWNNETTHIDILEKAKIIKEMSKHWPKLCLTL